MCGRFTMTRRDRSELAAMLGVPESELGDYVPRFNIAPTQPYFVLKTKYESREAIPAIWGLVNSWATDASRASMCINAKAETVDKIPSFREAFEKRRCVVPADGFYEWRGPKARREPLWIHPADDALLLFAGLFEAWQSQPGEWQTTFTIITTAANRTLEPIHNRMPVRPHYRRRSIACSSLNRCETSCFFRRRNSAAQKKTKIRSPIQYCLIDRARP